MSYTDQEMVAALRGQVEKFKDYYWKQHIQNYKINNTLVVAGIILSLAVTAVGFLGYGVLAGIIGLCILACISFQKAFNYGEKAEFYRMIHTEAKILRDRLRYRVYTASDFEAVFDAFASLRKHADEIPAGKGMEVVEELYAKQPSDTK
jgi:hypothetical protein